MNRAVLFGIATLVAIVGLSLLGSEKEAVAGYGCHGCCGVSACDGGGCFGLFNRCGGRRCSGLFNRCGGRRRHCGGLFSRRNRCCGVQDCCNPCPPTDCCNPCPPAPCGCAGAPVEGESMEGEPTPVPDAPEAPQASEASFRTIRFVK